MNIDEVIATLRQCEVVDLSHTLEEDMPCYGRSSPFFRMPWASYEKGDRALAYTYLLNEHTASHIDAPSHFVKGKAPIDELDLASVMGPCLTLDFRDRGRDHEVTADEIQAWESREQSISPGDMVLLRFGWDRFWLPKPNDKEFSTYWPGLGDDGAEYLVEKKVKLVGTDCFSIDSWSNSLGGKKAAPAHYRLLGNDVLVVEALANLGRLPLRSFLICLPLKFKGGSGSPIRAVALVPRA